jgi:acetylornithine/N-succinyldiaminopimelate aminotransferase
VIQSEGLELNAQRVGDHLRKGLEDLAKKHPGVVQNVRGLGLMLGMELVPNIPNLPGDSSKSQAVRFVNLLHGAGLLSIPAGTQVLRFLPPLNLSQREAEEGLKILESVAESLAR